MNIKVKKLEKGMGNEFAEYFANLSFSHEPGWSGCYCRFYHMDNEIEEWSKRTGEENRLDAIKEIDNGHMTGFLAYTDGKCIGWLNANDWASYKRLQPYVKDTIGDQKTGVVICYVVHPEYRGMGVAKALLNAAVEDFRKNGYDAVMALPLNANEFSQRLYRGTESMYEKAGFNKVGEFEYGQVFVRELK